METEKQNYILILYEKMDGLPPIHKGFKAITREDYKALTVDFKMNIEVNKTTWGIIERRYFKTPILDTMYYYVIIDAQKI